MTNFPREKRDELRKLLAESAEQHFANRLRADSPRAAAGAAGAERLARRNRDMANTLAGENLALRERVKQLGGLTKEDIEHAFGEERKPHA